MDPSKIISISPGGFMGFYLLGVCTFIKDQYDLSGYTFMGASAGSWNALFMTYKKDPHTLTFDLIDEIEKHGKNMANMEHILKHTILEHHTQDDFDLSRIQIGVTSLNRFRPQLHMCSEFTDLEDALNCCISSSHIPFITGGLVRKYKQYVVVDGGLTYGSYIQQLHPLLHITPTLWDATQKHSFWDTIRNAFHFSKQKSHFLDLYEKGYDDAKKNRNVLDSLLGSSGSSSL